MPRLFFPFVWGAPSVDTVLVVTTPPFWTKDAPGSMAWRSEAAELLPRFQHLYPQDSDIGWTKKGSP